MIELTENKPSVSGMETDGFFFVQLVIREAYNGDGGLETSGLLGSTTCCFARSESGRCAVGPDKPPLGEN